MLTVKKLIAELEKIENKFLDVELRIFDVPYITYEIDRVVRENKKVLIVTKDVMDE